MVLLVTSNLFTDHHAVAYGLLLVATACLGAGFGLTVPSLNTFTAVFHPDAVDRSVLALNALLGLGTALAPVFVAIFVGLGLLVGPAVAVPRCCWPRVLRRSASGCRCKPQTRRAAPRPQRPAIPARFWLYAAFAFLYGICETMNGNWSQLDMTTEVGASTTVAAIALTTFWAMVTVGRVVFASIQRWFPPIAPTTSCRSSSSPPSCMIASLSHGNTVAGVFAFGLAGLGCSALLPLTISFAQEDLVAISAGDCGFVIAAYQLGYGVAAFGAGPLQDAGVTLPTIFGIAAVAAARHGGAVLPDRATPSRGCRAHRDPDDAPHRAAAALLAGEHRCRALSRRGLSVRRRLPLEL